MSAVKSADIEFATLKAEELAVKSDLITLLVRAMQQRKLSQIEAAAL
jgi:predicted XRE-type DNA-binding protein